MPTDKNCHFFPLTSLQIGDLQSYLSSLTLFLAPESKKLLILVDNRPWLIDRAKPAHLWQLMVTKSRLSPFANTRAKRQRKDFGKRLNFKNGSKSIPRSPRKFYRWFSLIDAALYRKKAMLPVKKFKDSLLLGNDLHQTLYGFIIFEVLWDHVRGINYLNEMQTDTSIAFEAKSMKRWEFDSIEQASNCISSWYSGTFYEFFLLQKYLNSVSDTEEVFYDAEENSRTCGSMVDDTDLLEDEPICGVSSSFCSPKFKYRTISLHTSPPPSSGPYKRRKVAKSVSAGSEVGRVSEEAYGEVVSSPSHSIASASTSCSDSETEPMNFETTHYRDVLILFRFNDHDLPFRLKDIIMSDLRLLTLLEYGLPSWVIFLQSYPVFCHFYRPWMCPLARALYVLISLTTVLIGFYDLYKNVPVLKATASRLCGPFFEWIETWEMISRIKYLGTMLFLHNFEKAVKWVLMVSRAVKSLLSVLTKPLSGPILELVEFILPFWSVCLETVEVLSSIIWTVTGSTCRIVVSLVQILLWPLWCVLSIIWSIATSIIYPIFSVLWEILTAPIRLVLASINFISMLCTYIFYSLREAWLSVGSLFQIASVSEVKFGAHEASMWRSLWNDLFSQVFRALRSIIYGFVAFFTTCNRHRLSIYNHIRELSLRFSYTGNSSRLVDVDHSWQKDRSQSPVEGRGRLHGNSKHHRRSQEKARTRKMSE